MKDANFQELLCLALSDIEPCPLPLSKSREVILYLLLERGNSEKVIDNELHLLY